jgi:hypothetical protein
VQLAAQLFDGHYFTIVSGARFVCVVGVVGVVGDESPPQATRVMQRVGARKSSL